MVLDDWKTPHIPGSAPSLRSTAESFRTSRGLPGFASAGPGAVWQQCWRVVFRDSSVGITSFSLQGLPSLVRCYNGTRRAERPLLIIVWIRRSNGKVPCQSYSQRANVRRSRERHHQAWCVVCGTDEAVGSIRFEFGCWCDVGTMP